MKLRGRLVAGALMAGMSLALLSGCAAGGGSQGHGRMPVAVEVAETRAERVTVAVRAVGTLLADEEVEVRAEREGRLLSIHFEEGAWVERGALLARLDDEEISARVAEIEARVRQARARLEEQRGALERRRPLLDKQLVSEEEFRSQEKVVEAAEADLEAARATLKAARKQLGDTRITAPMAGITGARRLSPGDFVEKADLVVRIYRTDPLEVFFRLPERHLGRLALGQDVSLLVSAFPEEGFTGRVRFIDPAVDPVSRTVALKAEVPNQEGRLRPGLFVHVDVLLEVREDAVVIPEEAVVPREDGDWVFVVEEGVARRRKVRVGERMPGWVEVRSGLVTGEVVVRAGQQKLADGAEVRVIEEAPAGPESGTPLRGG